MQYSQYCRGPAAKAGRAAHEIPAQSGSIRSKDENLPERQVRELRASPDAKPTYFSLKCLSSIDFPQTTAILSGREREKLPDIRNIQVRLAATVFLIPLFAGLASFGAGSFFAFLRTLIFFAGIALFLPVANRLIQSGRKYRTFLILGGAFLAGMTACALAFPLTTSIIPRTCPIHYLLSGGVYLILFYGIYLLYVRYRFHWSYLFIYLTFAAMAGYLFHLLPIFDSLETSLTACLASILNALAMSFFLTVLFTYLNFLPLPPTGKKSGAVSSCIRIICYVFFGIGGYISFVANGIISNGQDRMFMTMHFSDSSVIKNFSGQLESYETALHFIPGRKPEKVEFPEKKNDKFSPDGQITIQREGDARTPAVFLYQGKKIYKAEPVYERGSWDGNRYLFPLDDKLWEELTFHGDTPPTVRTIEAQGAALVPGTDAVFYCMNHEFFLKKGNSKPEKIFSAIPFFNRFSTRYHPYATTFSPGFKYIFYACRRNQFLSLPTRILFIFEPAAGKVYIYDRLGKYRDESPIQWRKKK